MKIFALAEFDPAGVILSHRDLLRSKGVDFRVALHTAHTERQRDADWIFERAVPNTTANPTTMGSPFVKTESEAHDRESLLEFARSADVFVVCPSIGQRWAGGRGGWADAALPWGRTLNLDPPEVDYFGIDWRKIFRAAPRRVAYFHGSTNAWANRSAYSLAYRVLGCDLATSTVDYAAELPAKYLPPLVELAGPIAPLRGDDDPLIVAHCPTNPKIANTEEFLDIARKFGIVVRLVYGKSHEESIEAKRSSHATFDHLRGCFSVNSLEAAAVGSVPLFALTPTGAAVADEIATERPMPLHDLRGLKEALQELAKNPALTRLAQTDARTWYENHFSREAVTCRLMDFYA